MSKRKVNIDKCLTDPATDWEWISANVELSKLDILKAKDKLNWYWISINYLFNELEMRHYIDYLNWDWINLNGVNLTETFFREFADYIRYVRCLDYLIFTKEFRREFPFLNKNSYTIWRMKYKDACEFIDGRRWDKLSQGWMVLNLNIVLKFKNKVNWHYISQNKGYTIRFLRKFAKYLDWSYITKNEAMQWKDYKLNIFAKYLDWEEIKTWTWKKHSVSFVEKFGKRLGWT